MWLNFSQISSNYPFKNYFWSRDQYSSAKSAWRFLDRAKNCFKTRRATAESLSKLRSRPEFVHSFLVWVKTFLNTMSLSKYPGQDLYLFFFEITKDWAKIKQSTEARGWTHAMIWSRVGCNLQAGLVSGGLAWDLGMTGMTVLNVNNNIATIRVKF